jgi:hypothetical protein
MDKVLAGAGLGIIAATVLNACLTVTSPSYLPNAQSNYTRCISDGGTQQHCVEKYLLPTKGPNP